MYENLDGPPDVRMMGVVHDAIARDLSRSRIALSGPAAVNGPRAPGERQRRALAEHLGWLMRFLTRHHEGEDQFLYPLVRERNPGAAALLDAMDADHHAIEPAIVELSAAAAGYATSPDHAARVRSAIVALEEVLQPHLSREVDEVMPVVAQSITERDWRRYDELHNVGPLSKRELAAVGLFLLDGQTPANIELIASNVPAVPRWFILTFLSSGYRRAAYRRWHLAEHLDHGTPGSGGAVAVTSASPQEVWDLLVDVTRVAEWSHECRAVRWLDPDRSARVGARFRGDNRVGRITWSRVCTVETLDAPRRFTYRTDGGIWGDSTRWQFDLTPTAEGTEIAQSYDVVSMPWWFDRFVWRWLPSHRDRTAALRQDLERLAVAAARRPIVTTP